MYAWYTRGPPVVVPRSPGPRTEPPLAGKRPPNAPRHVQKTPGPNGPNGPNGPDGPDGPDDGRTPTPHASHTSRTPRGFFPSVPPDVSPFPPTRGEVPDPPEPPPCSGRIFTPEPYSHPEWQDDKAEGMIVIHQEKFPGYKDRLPIPKESVLVAYSAAALEMDLPKLPQAGFGSNSRYGDWFAYNPFDICEQFVEENPVLIVSVEFEDHSVLGAPVAMRLIDIQLTTRVVKLSGSLKDGKMSASAIANFTVHVSAIVPNGNLFNRITFEHFKEAFDYYDFTVYKSNEAGTKIAGKTIKGKGTHSGAFHFNIRPRSGNIYGADYPAQLVLKVMGTNQYIDYNIYPREELEGKMCLNGCHRYFPAAFDELKWHKGTPCKGDGSCRVSFQGRNAGPSADIALAAAIEEKDKARAEKACTFFPAGLCITVSKGKKCKFDHGDTDPKTIPCIVPRCKGTTCGYLHCEPSMEDCKLYTLRQRKRVDIRTGRWTVTYTSPTWPTLPRRGRQGWDSTLGYPGEGPLQMLGLNINGLNDAQDMHRLLKQAIEHRLDVIFLQEHRLKGSKIRDLIGTFARKGWAAVVSSADERGVGGTAILMREEAIPKFEVKVDRQHGDSLGGRVCAVDISLADWSARLVSVYVPAKANERGEFLKKLENSSIINHKTICEGDWNYVPDPSKDLKHLDPNAIPQPYAFTRGYESFIRTSGLEDTLRLVHGDGHRDYTRRGNTVWTRLDRFYSPKVNSPFRWTEVETDPLFFRGHDNASDHLAVKATMEWATPRKPTKADRRIDPRIFKEPEVRATVEMMWKDTHRRLSGISPSIAWTEAKKAIASFLLDETYKLTPERRKVKELESELSLLHTIAISKRPTPKLNKQIADTEKSLKEAKEKTKSSTWWNYIASLGEEVSSKVFYRRFRSKLSNSDISSIFITPNWEDPKTKAGTVTDGSEIGKQLEKYYRYLFKKKNLGQTGQDARFAQRKTDPGFESSQNGRAF